MKCQPSVKMSKPLVKDFKVAAVNLRPLLNRKRSEW